MPTLSQFPKTMKPELVLYIPLDATDNRRARVTISVLEDMEDDAIMPGICREPLVEELDEISSALVIRHYNLEDRPAKELDDDIFP